MNQIQYIGTGSASGTEIAASSPLTVTPNAAYVLSGFIDATNVIAGSPQWAVMNPALTATYGSVSQTAGVKGRVSGSVSIPTGVTSVVIVALTDNCTVSNGDILCWQAPQLEQATTSGAATAYKTNAFDDTSGAIAYAAHAAEVRAIASSTPDLAGSHLAPGTVNQSQINPNQVTIKHFIGDSSGDTTTPIFNASTRQFEQGVHDATVLLGSVTGNQRNMCPDSDMKFGTSYWTPSSGSMVIANYGGA